MGHRTWLKTYCAVSTNHTEDWN